MELILAIPRTPEQEIGAACANSEFQLRRRVVVKVEYDERASSRCAGTAGVQVPSMTKTGVDAMASVALARQSLQDARDDLDGVVCTVADVDADNTMASPEVMALLVRVVAAKRHLSSLELALAAEGADGDEHLVSVPAAARAEATTGSRDPAARPPGPAEK